MMGYILTTPFAYSGNTTFYLHIILRVDLAWQYEPVMRRQTNTPLERWLLNKQMNFGWIDGQTYVCLTMNF